MTARSVGKIALITGSVIATGIVGYALYFDYMRRNSPDFRRSIRKQHKRVTAAAEAKAREEEAQNQEKYRELLEEIQNEVPPISPEQQEAYFTEQVALGEGLAAQGPLMHITAATHFYRALRVYPNPIELLNIYRQVVPQDVFKHVIGIMAVSGNDSASGPAVLPVGGGLGFGGRGGGPGGAGGATIGATATPPPAAPTSSDVDDHTVKGTEEKKEEGDSPRPDTAESGTSSASGASWEKVDGSS